MTLAEELTAEAWERFARWEKRMHARFSECFEDVGSMERVDIYAKHTSKSKSASNDASE